MCLVLRGDMCLVSVSSRHLILLAHDMVCRYDGGCMIRVAVCRVQWSRDGKLLDINFESLIKEATSKQAWGHFA